MAFPFVNSLSLGCIIAHIGSAETRLRCLVEGEEVLNAGHVICCGIKASSATTVTVQGLCVQTSHPRQKPHELWFQLCTQNTIQGHCTCKAGKSTRCKHMIALLLFVHRTGIQNLETLTGTDVTQAWGKLKETPLYGPKKIKDLCHVRSQPRLRLEEAKLQDIRKKLIAAAPNSTLALHQKGRGNVLKDTTSQEQQSFSCEDSGLEPMLLMEHLASIKNAEEYERLLFHGVAFKDVTKLTIYKATMDDLPNNEVTFYKNFVTVTLNEALDIYTSTAMQDNSKWMRERMLRITGSKCHSLYRFVPSEERDWHQKIATLLCSNFKGNDATRYGKACEKPALEEYALKSSGTVATLGLVINPVLPWLGYSPDGVVFVNGKPEILLEVKSPVLGKASKAVDLIKEKKVPYIISGKENHSLRPTHAYYSQVQLGLFLLGLEEAHFIVYSKIESLVIPVKKDATFIDGLIRRLQYVYFAHYLPHLAKRRE